MPARERVKKYLEGSKALNCRRFFSQAPSREWRRYEIVRQYSQPKTFQPPP
jgi:hypothetical protein